MEAKHTPGPWKIDEAEDLPLCVIQDNEDGQGICELQGELFTRETATPEQWANASLIAAAPDLLAALEAVWGGRYSAGENGCMVHLTLKMCETIPAIIAKARGEA